MPGLAGYCRSWVPPLPLIASPLFELTRNSIPEPLSWEANHEQAFSQLQLALQQTPAPRLPNYTKPFALFVRESNNQALGTPTSELGGKQRSAADLSLDPGARAHPSCEKAAATAQLGGTSAELGLGHNLTLQVPHAGQSPLRCDQIQHFQQVDELPVRAFSFHLLTSVFHAATPSALLPWPDDGTDPRKWVDVVSRFLTLHTTYRTNHQKTQI